MIKRKAILHTFLCLLLFLTACSGKEKEHIDYLVLLGEEPSHIEAFPDCDVLVIDGEYFSAEDVKFTFDYYKELITSYRKKSDKLDIYKIQEYISYYKNESTLIDTLMREVF